MTIETKFNIGQNMWFLALGETPTLLNVTGINIGVHVDNSIIVRYYLNYGNYGFIEGEIFATKQELLTTA